MKFTIKITGWEEQKRKLSGFGMRAVNRAIGMKFRDLTLRNFGVSGPFRPTPWAPYARDYPKWGKKKGGPATLIRTGHLMQSIRVDSSHNDYSEVYSEGIPYADRHQFGFSYTPPRPYYPIVVSGNAEALLPSVVPELERAAQLEAERILNAS